MIFFKGLKSRFCPLCHQHPFVRAWNLKSQSIQFWARSRPWQGAGFLCGQWPISGPWPRSHLALALRLTNGYSEVQGELGIGAQGIKGVCLVASRLGTWLFPIEGNFSWPPLPKPLRIVCKVGVLRPILQGCGRKWECVKLFLTPGRAPPAGSSCDLNHRLRYSIEIYIFKC